MKQYFPLLIFSVAVLVGITSCKSSEENYRAAYDITVQRQREMQGVDETTYARIEAERTANTTVIDGDSVRMLVNRVNIVDGTAGDLKPYNVVVGEYKQLFNARSFRNRLAKEGHPAYVVKNSESTYYVIVQGFDTAQDAAGFLNTIADRITMKIPIKKPWILSLPDTEKRQNK